MGVKLRMMKLIKVHGKDVMMILLGNFILACAITFFVLPYNILTGGIFGVAIALKPLIPFIDTNYIAYAMIFITFVLGFLLLGKSFAAKTALSSFAYPGFLEILRNVNLTIEIDPILASLYGGLLVGVAVGLVFRAKGSTGGMDVFPLILSKYFNVKPSQGVLMVDSLTVLLGVSTLGISHVLLGLISVFASSFTIDKIIMFGSESTKSVYIISKERAIINQRIQEELNRGTTIIQAEGGYSREDRDIIMCVITMEQYPILKSIVYSEDENAFVIVQEAHEILGEGFSFGHRV